jgi:hypothetical protein
MALVLQNEHLEKINALLVEIPFKHAYPLFQLLTNLINDQNAKEKEQQKQHIINENHE